MTARRSAVLGLIFCLAAGLLSASRRRDPLTDTEVDQLREAAQAPDVRLRLYVKFTRARMVVIEQLRGDPKLAENRGKRIHDLLEDLSLLEGELNDNMSNYAGYDVRKALKEIVELDAELQLKLRSLKEASDDAAVKESGDYRFALQDTIESVNDNADSAREMLDEQNKLAKEKKLKKSEPLMK